MDKKFKSRLITESSYPLTLSLLLEGEEDAEKAQEASLSTLKAIKSRLDKIKGLINSIPTGAYKSGLSKIIDDKIGKGIQTLMDKAQGGTDPSEDLEAAAKEAGLIAGEADEASKALGAIIKINLAMMQELGAVIKDGGLLDNNDAKDIPLIETLKETDMLNDVALALIDAFDKAYKPPEKEKGFFAKIAAKLGFDFGWGDALGEFDDNKEDLVNAILELTPVEIAKFGQAMFNYGKEDEQATEQIEQQTEKIEDTVEDEAGSEAEEGGESGEGGESDTGEAEERPEFDLMAFVKEKYPELFKALELQSENNPEVEENLEDLDKQIEDGEISPDEVIEDLEADVEEAGEDELEGVEDDGQDPEEAIEEAESELEAAAQEAAESEDPPGVAISKALDDWAAGLSKTSQGALNQAGRLDGLKDSVNASLEALADVVVQEVEKAVQQWRAEHEETLMRSKRFAKKNFDSLENLIPQIAAAMLKKTNESNVKLTKGTIKKSVYKFLNKRFKSDGILTESITTRAESITSRWQKLAGIK